MKRSAFFVVVLLGLVLTGAARAQLVVNGGFETGDFTGWVVTDASGFTLIGSDPTGVKSGNHFAYLGASPNPGSLLQNLNTTPGQTYQLQFFAGE